TSRRRARACGARWSRCSARRRPRRRARASRPPPRAREAAAGRGARASDGRKRGRAMDALEDTVDFDLQANLIVVGARVAGAARRFVLDTGASGTVVGRDTARELGLDEVQKRVGHGAGGDVEMALVKVDSLHVGRMAVTDLTCMAIDIGS